MDYPEPEYRRRAPRIHTPGWSGKCIVEDDPEAGWNECRLLDVSLLGLGLEIMASATEEIIGRRLVLHIDVDGGASISLRLVGPVKRVDEGEFGGTRIGVEFLGLNETEQSVLKIIEHLRVGW